MGPSSVPSSLIAFLLAAVVAGLGVDWRDRGYDSDPRGRRGVPRGRRV